MAASLTEQRPGRQPWGPYVPPGAGRDQRIDLLRGFCVVAMIVDHIAGPSFLYAFTGGNRFYTSAAEAFIFISGLVMGLVYHRLIERDGLGISLRRAIERAMTLYLLTITLSLIFIPLSEVLGLHWSQGLDFASPGAFVVSILTLHRTYYLVDIPLLYTILILIAPLGLTLLAYGRWPAVLGMSWLLWGVYQFFPEQAGIPWQITGNYLFFLSAWQVFFFTGLVLGWHHGSLTQRLTRFPRRLALGACTVGLAILIAVYMLTSDLSRFFPADPDRAMDLQLFLLENVFAKGDVRPGRIVASLVVFGFFYLLVTEAWRPINRALGRFLIPLGQSALYAYAAHIVLTIPITLVLDSLTLPDRFARPLNAAVQIATLILIWGLIRARFMFVNPSAGKARYTWPVAATVCCLVLLPLDPTPGLPGVVASPAEPDPYAARVARAFGTPVPGRPPRGEGTAVPLPRVSARQVASTAHAQGQPPVSEYVGPIRGTFRNLTFYSPALERDMPYFVYLPPGYEDEGRRYSVLYMLHGNSGHYEEWAAYGLIDRADRMIAAREILPLIIVLPQGDFSYWVNLADGQRYGDYVAQDLVRHIDATYRVLPGPDRRAIGGLSMGGTGALSQAFRNPNLFRVVGAHSPSLPEDDGTRPFLGEGPSFDQRDPIGLGMVRPNLHLLSIWIDIGDEDAWFDRVEILDEVLGLRNLDYNLNVFPGDHDGDYWAAHIADYLRFYDQGLNPERRL